tara:strand:- start:1069 stop:3252 length:2184 start_codon:yes stop_codon:yes gene_type:complete
MPVCHEIKSQLAKLLATEDLIVEHKKVETAEFNVHTRVLTLPMWEKASNNVYDSLVAHEVGHALYTPDVEPPKDVPHTFINITEDARIEKLMRRRYGGIAKTFYNGYHELSDDDFFDVADKNIADFNLADRINLYFKIGSFVDISFSVSEKEIVDLVRNSESFDDAVNAARVLYSYCQHQMEDDLKEQIAEAESAESIGMDIKGSGRPDLGEDDSEYDEEDDGEDGNKIDVEYQTTQSSSQVQPTIEELQEQLENLEPDVETVESFNNAVKDLVDNDSAENHYVELPEINLDKIIISNELIHHLCHRNWEDYKDKKPYRYDVTEEELENLTVFSEVDLQYAKFKKSAQKEVSYLVKEFECKKAADSYARSTVAKTGILNTSKLHTYNFNEDLFKKINVVPDGKNHGLVFILDWSGSMADVMEDTIKQLYNLIWFCRKVSIPFEVYAFTLNFPNCDEEGKPNCHSSYVAKSGVAALEHNFSLMNLFTSDVNGKELEKQMLNIFRCAKTFNRNNWTQYGVPLGMNLSGTPLNETLVCLHKILPQFKKNHQLQKVQCVILTDGEANPIRYHREVQRPWEEDPFLGTNYVGWNTFLRDRTTGNVYKFTDNWRESTSILIRNLKDKFTDMNFVGIRLLSPRDGNYFIRQYCGYSGKDFERATKDWKKTKSFSIKCSGYDSYFGLSAAALSSDDEFEVESDATKAQIKRAFFKSLKGKKMNKKILGEFVDLVV